MVIPRFMVVLTKVFLLDNQIPPQKGLFCPPACLVHKMGEFSTYWQAEKSCSYHLWRAYPQVVPIPFPQGGRLPIPGLSPIPPVFSRKRNPLFSDFYGFWGNILHK